MPRADRLKIGQAVIIAWVDVVNLCCWLTADEAGVL
jgi:hypothetical protein